MYSSDEIVKAAEKRGIVAEILYHGTSYRAGGTILIVPCADWRDFTSMNVSKVGEAFDGTGYDGRGRHFDVFRITDGGKWRIATLGEFEAVGEDSRLMLGSDYKSGDSPVLLVDKEVNATADLDAMFGDNPFAGLNVPVEFRNFTPHVVRLNDGRAFESDGVARVSNSFSEFDENGICSVHYGEVHGLPEEVNGVIYIVSTIVKLALPDRKDLVVPATGHPNCVREDGQVVSVPGFVK